MGRKPSVSKQIAEVLKTDNKHLQLERVENLVRLAATPSVAVTALYAAGRVQVSVVGGQVSADDVKFVLQKAIDDITEQTVMAKLAEDMGAQGDGPIEDIPDKEPVGPQTGDTMANGDMTP